MATARLTAEGEERMKNRILSSITLCVLVCALAGCGSASGTGGSAEPAAESSSESAVDSAAASEAAPSPAEGEDADSGADSAAALGESAESAAESGPSAAELEEAQDEALTAQDEAFALGTISEGQYVQTFFHMQAELSDPWSFYDREQMAEANTLFADAADDSGIKKIIDEGNPYLDMIAANSMAAETVNVSITKMPGSSNLTDVSEYIETLYPDIEEQLSAQGLSNIHVEKTVAAFMGEEMTATMISADAPVDESSTYPYYELQVYVKEGRYVACVTATSMIQNTTQEVLDQFSRKE